MRKAVVFTGLCLLLLTFAGCFTTRSSKSEQQLAVSKTLVIPDLPVPKGFKIDSEHSYFNVNPNSRTRVVFVTYKGRAEIGRLLEFYRENMPISGWALQKESCDFGAYTLSFTKEAEAAEVRITPGRLSSNVSISLNPSSGNSG